MVRVRLKELISIMAVSPHDCVRLLSDYPAEPNFLSAGSQLGDSRRDIPVFVLGRLPYFPIESVGLLSFVDRTSFRSFSAERIRHEGPHGNT
jgi:hypothetical protein